LQRKGKGGGKGTSESMFGLFFRGNMADSSCKRLRPKTARVSRAEKKKSSSQHFSSRKNHTLLRAHTFHTFYIIDYQHIEV